MNPMWNASGLKREVRRDLLLPNGELGIVVFMNAYRFLSNFHEASVRFEGKLYPTTEHAYQAAKTLNPILRDEIRAAETPADAKKLGGKVELRSDWEQVKYGVMLEVVRYKFHNHPDLACALLDTGDAVLIEGNWWHDRVWGRCTCENCKGKGTNWLGEILMKVRAELREGAK